MAEQIQKLQNFFTRDNRATFIRINKYSDPGTLRYSLYKQAEVKYVATDECLHSFDILESKIEVF